MIKTEVSLLFLILHYLSLWFSFDSGCPMNFIFIWSDTSLNQPEQLNYLAVQLVPIWNQAGKSYILPEIRQGRVVFYLSNVLICEWHYIWPSFNSNYWKSFKKIRYRQNCFLIKTILMIKKLKQNFNKFKLNTFSEFKSNSTHTFWELIPNKSKQIFRVHIKHYWHFQGVTPKQC